MELIKQNKALSIVILILITWLLGLTVFQFILSNSNKNLSTNTPNNFSAPSATVPGSTTAPVTNSNINPATQISAFAEDATGKIYGKYNPEDFDYFGGQFITQMTSNGNAVLVVSGYLNLKPEILTNNPASFFQMETKYIEIGKNTKITDDQGAVAKIEDLGPEDYLKIVPYEAAEYPATYMLANTIVITKKIWPEGENPFN